MERPAPADVPADVPRILQNLWSNGHAAYLAGGGVHDSLLGRAVTDWDIATDALPEQTMSLFPGGQYANRFGTVTVHTTVPSDPPGVEVTTFRRDHRYADHRRPDSVTFTDSLEEDLARRDFTVNAIAWGRPAASETTEPQWVDPTGGLADLNARVLRAVGDPKVRFDEDGLRLLRAARLAAQLGFDIEPATLAAMEATSDTARWVSSERVGGELRKMVAADPPSRAFAILADTGVLDHALPELAAQRGVPQDKVTGHDLWGHSLTSLDGAAKVDPGNELLRVTALLHDIGKPPTYADGHFIGHDEVGAEMAERLLTRLAYPRHEIARVSTLISNHMFSYEPRWSGAAVRRFIRRVGREQIDDLIKLRRADNVGSGLAAGAGHVDELEARINAELEARSPLTLQELAVDGDDLIDGLGLAPGPIVGELLERLLGSVIADPSRNTRERLLAEARAWNTRTEAQAQ
ncbi:MAG: CCA tRNA nucleotidyltransferase [Candidatus Limnocylindrales bacterium]